MKLLDVGCGEGTNASIFGDRVSQVVRLDIDPANNPDVVHDILKPFPDEIVDKFDIVLASHVLEHIHYRKVAIAATNIVSAAKPGGEVWMFVPSMEWACKQFLSGRETFGLMGTVFGGQADPYDFHYCGFTRNSLAVLMTRCGCENIRISEQNIHIVLDGTTYPSVQISAMGLRKV